MTVRHAISYSHTSKKIPSAACMSPMAYPGNSKKRTERYIHDRTGIANLKEIYYTILYTIQCNRSLHITVLHYYTTRTYKSALLFSSFICCCIRRFAIRSFRSFSFFSKYGFFPTPYMGQSAHPLDGQLLHLAFIFPLIF